jgi:hypothetical protein
MNTLERTGCRGEPCGEQALFENAGGEYEEIECNIAF